LAADQIKVGADWYSNYPIMSIPDLSSFLVDVPIPEVYRGRVRMGMPATVLVDAIPGLVLSGKLTSVSSVSRPKFQADSTSPPVYDAVLALDVADPRMVAGMTVRVEISTANLPNVMYVPVEGVFNEEGKTASFIWVDGKNEGEGYLEKRPVLTGQSNDHFVEVKNGLHEGDRLALSRPASHVTPTNYREQVDAMFPAATTMPSTAPSAARAAGPTGGPTGAMRVDSSVTQPEAAMRAEGAPATTRPASTRPVARGARATTVPSEAVIIDRESIPVGAGDLPARGRRGGAGAPPAN
jgi:hypothetical protein